MGPLINVQPLKELLSDEVVSLVLYLYCVLLSTLRVLELSTAVVLQEDQDPHCGAGVGVGVVGFFVAGFGVAGVFVAGAFVAGTFVADAFVGEGVGVCVGLGVATFVTDSKVHPFAN